MAESEIENNMSVFTNELNSLPDLAKNFLFQAIVIPEEGTPLATFFKEIGGTSQFMIRCRKASIPKKSFEGNFETHYMGSKKKFPGKAVVDGDMTLEFDEFQDLIVSKMLHGWQNLIYDQSINEDGGDLMSTNNQLSGGSVSNYLKDYTAKIQIVLYDSTKKKRLPVGWVCYQCWPNDVSEVSLGYEESGKLTRSVTFSYNTWQMIDSDSL